MLFLLLCFPHSIGIIYGFAANHYLRTHIRETNKLADSNFRDLRTLLNVTGPQLNYVLAQYTTTKKRAFSDLDNIKILLGGDIQDHLIPQGFIVLDDVKHMAEEIQETSELLMIVNKDLWELTKLMEEIYKSLRDVKSDLERSLKDPVCNLSSESAKCNFIRMSLGQLDNNINLRQLQILDEQVDRVKAVLQTNLSSLVQMGYNSITDIPDRVGNQTTDIVAAVRRTLNDIGLNIKTIKQKVPIQEKLSVFLDRIDNLESNIYRELPRVEKYESYRWLSFLIICCLLTLIMIFYYLGLLCGVFGYNPNATPTTRGYVSNTGGIFLMAGVGVSFFFCWISMLFVVLTFVIGANIDKLVCDPYQNKELFQIIDTPYLLNENWKYYLSGMVLNKPDINLTFEQVYSDCKDNKGIYTACSWRTSTMSVSISPSRREIGSHIRHMNAEFKKMQLDLDTVLLSKEGRKSLLDFSVSGVEQINYDSYLAETSKPVTKVKLLKYASDLKAQADKLPPGDLRDSLEWNVNEIKDIHLTKILPLEPELEELHNSIQELQQKVSGLKVKVTNIVDSLDSTQKFITYSLPAIIIRESEEYADIIVSYFEHYLTWAKMSVEGSNARCQLESATSLYEQGQQVTKEIAACKPVATALDSAVDVFLCKYITKPMNLFWFGIGKATILLLPAIIIAVKLAKYYRRMDSEDVYEE
ncbi:hypothetical protein QTO34_008506 [Cnephaeus nilssonii]|uniref:Prominin-1 n=1 Tax=Cnephaeus nilssonii TaxID=3371016 RepID=A0AA40LWC7_CNENI|nr:hypothetical protein QTO34_008506 [Eptesicus nilssonii]